MQEEITLVFFNANQSLKYRRTKRMLVMLTPAMMISIYARIAIKFDGAEQRRPR